jgi:hypothetical protein
MEQMTGPSYAWTGFGVDDYWSDQGNWSPTVGFAGSIGAGSTATIAGDTYPWIGAAVVINSPLIFNAAVLADPAEYIYDVVNQGAIDYVGGEDYTSATTYNVTAPDMNVWGDVLFTGGGTVSFADLGATNPEIDVASSAWYYFPPLTITPTLENVDNTFTGAAWFSGLGAGLIFQNDVQGVVDANGADGMTFYAMHVDNNGVLAATGGGGLTLNNTTVDQTTGDGQTATGQLGANGADVQLDFATIDGGTLTASNGGVFETVNGGIDMLNGSTSAMTMTAGTHFEVQDNGVLEMIGTFSSAGEIDLEATATLTAALKIQGTVTPGAIVMSDEPTGDNGISGGGSNNVLDNTATISGAGEFSGLGAGLSVTNQSGAVIDATGANYMYFYSVDVTNNGTLEATGAGGLDLAGLTLNQNGGGALTADSAISLDNVTIEGGTLSGTGVASVTGGVATLTGATSAVTVAAGAAVAVDDGESLYLTGTIASSGAIDLDGSSRGAGLGIEGTVTPGNIVMSDAPNNANEIAGEGTNNVLDNTATISGAGEFIWYGPGLSVINEVGATINANGANAITIAGVNVTNKATMEATGAGGLILSGMTLTQSGAGDLLASGGNLDLLNATVNGGAVGVASGQTLTMTNSVINAATVTLGADVDTDLTGSNDTVDYVGASGVSVGLFSTSAGWDTVDGSFGTIALDSAEASVVGGGDTINFAGGSGDALSLYQTNGAFDAVYGSDAPVMLNSAQASVVGGYDLIMTAGASTASLYNTAGDWDAVYGSGANVILNTAEASVIGGSDVIETDGASTTSLYNTGGEWDTVYGSGANIILNAAQASVVGGCDAITTAGASSVSLWNTGGDWDAVYGSGASVVLNAAQAAIVGGANLIETDGASSASLWNTGGAWDAVYGSGANFILMSAQASVFGGSDVITTSGVSTFSLYDTGGNWDAVYATDDQMALVNAQASIFGGFDRITAAGASSVSLYETAGNWDTVFASNDQVVLVDSQASVFGADDVVTETAGSAVSLYNSSAAAQTVIADGASLTLVADAASLTGSNDTTYFDGGSTLTVNGSSEVFGFAATLGQSTITGFESDDAIYLSAQDWSSFDALTTSGDLTQSNGNAVIKLDASDQITLVGVQASSLTSAQFDFR